MENKKDKIEEVYSLMRSIFCLRSQLEEKPIRFSEDVVLTPREMHTIAGIDDHENINIKEIGDYFGVSKSAASQMITKLTRKGFVRKVTHPGDNREYRLTLTESGKKAYDVHREFHAVHAAAMKKELTGFTEDEITAAAKVLKVIENTIRKRLAEL